MLYWTGRQLRPDVPLYAAPLIFTIPGPFDVTHFCAAVQTVMDQSDALRTIIQVVDGVPQQIVQPYALAPIKIRDFSAEAEPETAARDWFHELIAIPFDLEKSLVQFAVAKIAPDKHIWLLNQHHVIADAASSFHIYHVISRTYEQLLHPDCPTPPTITPFQTYREFEREYRNSPQFERAGRYWQEKLSEDVSPLRFFGQPGIKKNSLTKRLNIELDEERT